MWKHYLFFLFISICFNGISCRMPQNLVENALKQNVISTENYVFWSNATVPFYVNPDHFDHEQSLTILTALSMFAFKTCLKFAPVMAAPASNERVLVFENSAGVRRCLFDTLGHSVFEPHRVTLGYECLESPHIDMMVMRSLGFPFEHNRIDRASYIDVLNENIEPGSTDLFTKEATQPIELQAIPYDINSVMHFGTRDFSKNGHRTILFKDHNVQQNRVGLTKTDLKKIEIIYGPECRTRDRQEKLELCQSYPGVARKKRDINLEQSTSSLGLNRIKRDLGHGMDMSSRGPEIQRKKRDLEDEPVTKNLRVNPDITPPPNVSTRTLSNFAELGIEEAVDDIVIQVNKVTTLALKNARERYCNNTKPYLRAGDFTEKTGTSDLLGIVEVIGDYAQDMVSNAIANLTKFCEEAESIHVYLRAGCMYNDGSERCRQSFKSTKSGRVQYSTKHRPLHYQSTNYKSIYDKKYKQHYRAGNDTDEATTISAFTEASRKKREGDNVKVVEDTTKNLSLINKQDKKDSEQDKKLSEQKKDKAENSEGKVENKELNSVLRSGTSIPSIKQNRYEPLRISRRNRVRHTKESEDIDDSSLSTESKKPRKKQPKESTEIKDVQNPEEFTDSKDINKDNREPKRIKNKKKHLIEPKKEEESMHQIKNKHRDYREKKVEVEEIEEAEHTSASNKKKRPRKVPTRSDEKNHRVVELSKANKEFYNDRTWPGGIVKYTIKEDSNYDMGDLQRRLQLVNDILTSKTCVRLKKFIKRHDNSDEDYLEINTSPDYVTGRVGGKQSFGSLELFRGDQHKQHTAMMVMAMLGFYFEVSRHDRDKYVRVHMRHIRPDKLHHFEKIREDATLPLPYDYKSATHPAWQFWRHIGKTRISSVATYKTRDPDGEIMSSLGQNTNLLSDIDIVKINSVYGISCFKNKRSGGKRNKKQKSTRRKEIKE